MRRKAENRQELLDKGTQLFMSQGYHGTGVKELVDSVGIPKGSFYQYFNSKEHFGAEAVYNYIGPFIELLGMHLQNRPNDALGALRAYFQELIVESEKNDFRGGCLLGNLLGEVGETDGVCQQALEDSVKRYCAIIQAGVEKAQQEGTITNSISGKDAANLIFCAWQGALLRMKVVRSAWPLEQCIETIFTRSLVP